MIRSIKRPIYLISSHILTVEAYIPYARVRTPKGRLKLFSPGFIPYARARTFFSKERDTIEWINHFKPNSVFWDVGANVGTYSVYAASNSGCNVLAFEPAAGNYFVLNKNIEANHLDKQISAFALAFYSKVEINHFFMKSTSFGTAFHTFASAIDWEGKSFDAKFRQTMLGFPIDKFIGLFSPNFPDYLKIDVDGNELDILQGATKTLRDPRLKSVMVEIDLNRKDYRAEILKCMSDSGFHLVDSKCERPVTPESLTGMNHYFSRKV